MSVITIYCSGSIQKGESDNKKLCWTEKERMAVARGAAPDTVAFLNPDDPASDLSDTEALFGRDLFQVETADAVIVDARERRGIGIGIEMVISRLVGSLLVIVAPRNSYYRMDSVSYRGGTVQNYVHPHIAVLADAVVDDFEAAGAWLREAKLKHLAPKGQTVLSHAVAAYKCRLLPSDRPMQDLLKRLSS